jgi:acetyltransferase-like isoleucine patch superfamily enzyme
MNLKLSAIRLLRPILARAPFSTPVLKKLQRRLELGELNRTDLVQYRVERAKEMGATIGKNCRFFSLHIFSEPTLVDIGDNTIMSGDVVLLTHDGAIHSSKYDLLPDINGFYGRISIGRNCFIGYGTIIMPNVRLGDGCIVCPGSVVLESFPENTVIRGNPAQIIATREEWVREKERSPNTIIDPVYRFPIVIPEDVMMQRVGSLPLPAPRGRAASATAAGR